MTPPASRRSGSPAGGSRDERGRSSVWAGVDQETTVVARFLAGPAAWGGLGWLADRWLDTSPWLLAIGVMVGFVGSFLLVWHSVNQQRPLPKRQASSPTTDPKDTPRADAP